MKSKFDILLLVIVFGLFSPAQKASGFDSELEALITRRPSSSWDTIPLCAHFGDRDGMSDADVERSWK